MVGGFLVTPLFYFLRFLLLVIVVYILNSLGHPLGVLSSCEMREEKSALLY